MRNKGFFWFLTIVLAAVCVYQLSFTLVATNVEEKAAKEAVVLAEELRESSKDLDSAMLPNGTYVDFKNPEAFELAKAAFLNQLLSERAQKEVYPVLGSTFQEVKKRSLALGLDLVGGMSVTVEIDVAKFVESFARNPRDLNFKRPFESAVRQYTTTGGDFVDLFRSEYEKMNKGRKMVQDLMISEIDELSINSTNGDVEDFFRDRIASSMTGVEQIMAKRINQFGVAQPNIQRDFSTNRLYIELPGVQDEKTVADKIKNSANLEFFETYPVSDPAMQGLLTQINALSRQVEVKMNPISAADSALIAADTTLTDSMKLVRMDSLMKAGSTPTSLSAAKPNKGWQELVTPGGPSAAIVGSVAPENKLAVDKILAREDIQRLFPDDLRMMWGAQPEKTGKGKTTAFYLYAVRIPEGGKAFVGGKDIKYATKSRDPQSGQIAVDLKMTPDGADRWGTMTQNNLQRPIAITMDNVVYSAPNVISAITDGNTQITGNFTIAEADDLAGLLNGGALPAPCVIKDQTKVGPSIGAENAQAGMLSFALAFLAVFIYMYFYYGRGGLVANIALFVNVILIFGCLASFGAVLTLAGIAGIVLTIGTAVDANILIFERIREEQRRGVDQAGAVEIGFKKALPSIIDANVTHLLVAIILKVFGTGEIESFATTLIIGIFTSLFSAIVISKLIITTWIEKGKVVSFSTKTTEKWFQNFHFDWVGKRKYFYIFSIVVTIIGGVSLFTRGLKQSVEFTGGRNYGVKFENKADIEYIRKNLESVFVENGEAANVTLKTKSNDYNIELTTNYKLADDNATEEVTAKLKEGLEKCEEKLGKYEITESRSISASVSSELWKSAVIAITLSLIAIFAYILIRFGQWQYSIGAILALAHDVMFVLSIFSLLHGILPFSLDVDQAFIAAVLTVIGYSMNDTVIVFDRIRENLRKGTNDHKGVINQSLNTTLSRTFNTSMILFVVLLVMFIFGGPSIKGFLFALLVGVVIGTYSSLCVATPILIDFSKRLGQPKEKKAE